VRLSSYRMAGSGEAGAAGVGVWRGERLHPVPGVTRLIDLLGDDGSDAYPYLRAGDLVRLEGGPLGAIEAHIAVGRPAVPLRPAAHDHKPDHEEAGR
jgi:hypothetical protein